MAGVWYADLLDCTATRLIEPFAGSGAVFFHVEPTTALLSDSNEQLIEAYEAVRDEPEAVLAALRRHHRRHNKSHYYEVRASRPRALSARGAKFIYLNRTCFNGIYRVNLRGEFNVPMGSKASVLRPNDDFFAWADLLKHAELVAQDFDKTLAGATSGDLVYADPPYTVKHNMNNFVKYNERIFSWADQERLAESLHDATGRGACVVVSNADSPSIREFYSGPGWVQTTVARHSRLAASSDNRRPTTEIVVSNCHTQEGDQAPPRVCRPPS